MKTEIVRTPQNDRYGLKVPDDPFDLTGIAVDYGEGNAFSFVSGVLKRMQFDTAVIGSNFVTTGSGWQFKAMSSALFMINAVVTLAIKAGVTYNISIAIYVNGVVYRAVGQIVAGGSPVGAQSVQLQNIIPLAKDDTIYFQLNVTSSDASDTPIAGGANANYINILRLWKTYQQSLGIPSSTPPPDDGSGSHARG